MKQFLSGSGVDTTATVLAWMKSHKQIEYADLYLIGEFDDPNAFWLTNYPSSLEYSLLGKFNSTVIKRGSVRSAIGLEADLLDVTWSPKNKTVTSSIASASPYQLAQLGWFDNMRFRMWRTYMPTPGDADTFGAAEWFAGWIGDISSGSGSIEFSVNNYLYALNQKVPSGVMEATSTYASYTGGVPPTGYGSMPQFLCRTCTPTVLHCDQLTPHPNTIPSDNALRDGYVVFMGGSGQTLQGQYSIIGANSRINVAPPPGTVDQCLIQLFSPLPWAPTANVDKFYVSMQAPIDGTDPANPGFPYVPGPETAA